jgi:hypothetical protein
MLRAENLRLVKRLRALALTLAPTAVLLASGAFADTS